MRTDYLLLSLYEKPFLSLQETCKAIGISLQFAYNSRSDGTFPIPMLDHPLRASIQDIAQYIDQQREQAKEKIKLKRPMPGSIQDIAQYIDQQREQAKEKISHE